MKDLLAVTLEAVQSLRDEPGANYKSLQEVLTQSDLVDDHKIRSLDNTNKQRFMEEVCSLSSVCMTILISTGGFKQNLFTGIQAIS